MATAAAIAAIVALIAVTSSILTGPDRVDVVIENPTAYVLSVRVSDADGGSSQPLGSVSAGRTREFSGVLDQGDGWLFEFSYAGVQAAEVVVEGSEVASAPVVVPASAEQVLEQAGLSPPPG